MKQKLFKELIIKYSRRLYDAYQRHNVLTDEVAKHSELSEFSFCKGILIGYIDSKSNIKNTEKIIKYILDLNFDIMRIFKNRDEFANYFYELLYEEN